MSAADRAHYAARHAQLLDALLSGADPPAGFAVAQAAAAGRSLRRKRARAVEQAWPALALALGEAFDARFDAFARAVDAGSGGSAVQDGLAFVRSLPRGVRRRDDVRVELLLARAVLHRRGVLLRAAWLRRLRRLLVVARLPRIGAVHRSFPRRACG